MQNICQQVIKLSVLLIILAMHGAALAKSSPTALNWPRKCLMLKYSTTEAEWDWRVNDKLHQMVSDRDIWSLAKYLKKDMLKGQKPVPIPYLYNASGISVPGYGDYDPGSKMAIATMEEQGEEVVRLLLWAGANPDEAGLHGTTPVMLVGRYGHRMPKVSPRILKRLLAAGANPDLRDVNGWTALMFAANNGSTDIARQLLAHGARRDFHNCAGQTAADIAKAKGHASLAKLLQQ